MKKFIKIGFIMLIAGGIITGCGTKIESNDLKEVKNAEQLIVETKAVEEQQPLIVDGIEIPDLSVYQIQATEYTDLKFFIENSIENWSDDSDYKSGQSIEDAEWTLANAALHYINYFQEDIDKMGLTKDFKELQIIAYKITKNDFNYRNGDEERNEDFIAEYKTKLNEIYSKM